MGRPRKDQPIESEQELHPELLLPYETWIPYQEQDNSGALWRNLVGEQMRTLIEKMRLEGAVFVMIRRKSKNPMSDNYRAFERVVFVRRPENMTNKKHIATS